MKLKLFGENNIDGRIVRKMLLNVMATTMIVELVQSGSSFIDGIITSRFYGNEEMAAIGLAYPVFSMAGIITGFISTGMLTLCSREMGRGDTKRLKQLFGESMTAGLFMSLITATLLITFRVPVARLLGATGKAENLLEPTVSFMMGLIPCVPPLIMVSIIASGIQMDGGNKIIRVGTVTDFVVNISLDIIAATLGMDIFWIGLATTLGRWANLLVLLRHFKNKDGLLEAKFLKISIPDLGSILKSGSANAARRATNVATPLILNNLVIAAGGSAAMTVMSVRNSLNNVAEIPLYGISIAVSVITGIFYGEINKKDILETGKLAHRWSVLLIVLEAVILILFAGPIAAFYVGADSEIFNLMVFAIICLSVRLPLCSLIDSRITYLQATQKIKLSLSMTIFVRLISVSACALLLNSIYGTYGIMAAFPAASILTMITVFIIYQFKSKRLLPKADDYLSLDETFDIHPKDIIEYPVRNLEDASLAAEQLQLFAKGHKIPEKRCYYAALCVEEMLAAIIEHGFSSSNDKTIDLRVVISEGDIVIRLRDDCRDFGLLQEMKLIEEESKEDFASNIGIRMVSKIAKDITTFKSINSNNTIIRV